MPARPSDEQSAVLNEFLRRLCEDLASGGPRPLASYQADAPGHEVLIEEAFLRALHEESLASSESEASAGVRSEAEAVALASHLDSFVRAGAADALEKAAALGSALEADALEGPRDGGAAASAEVGSLLGRYRLLRELGRGGQGTVYLAEDTSLGRAVALKVLAASSSHDSSALSRFRREALLASKLEDPRICAVHDADVCNGIAYIAMRYVEGETLAEKIRRAAAAPTVLPCVDLRAGQAEADPRSAPLEDAVERIVHVIEHAARALDVAHGLGIVHRDIKPSNLMITATGEPVILDFGLARSSASDEAALTLTGERFGTPAYMAPEQIAAHGRALPDRRTDVWALGVTLYEALTLHHPFQAPTREGLFRAIETAPLPDPRAWNRAISKDLVVVLETAAAKEPDRRYRTALDLAEDLRRIREREPIAARPASALLRLKRWSQRNPALASAIAVIFLALVAGLVVTNHFLQATRRDRDEKAFALRRAESARLNALAYQHLERDPGLALLLAIESEGEFPIDRVNRACLAALAALQERRTLLLGQAVVSISVSPDGKLLAAALKDGSTRLWELESFREVFETRRWPAGVTWVRFAPRGSRLALGCAGGELHVLDLGGGGGEWRAHVPSLLGEPSASGGDPRAPQHDVLHLAWSEDGSRLAAMCADAACLVLDGASGALVDEALGLRTERSNISVCCALNADGTLLALASGEKRGQVRRVASGEVIDLFRALTVDFKPGEDTLAIVTTTARMNMLSVGKSEKPIPFPDKGPAHPRKVSAVCWSPDGKTVATASFDGTTALWNAATGERREVCAGHRGFVTCLAFYPDSRRLVTASPDGSIRIWEPRSSGALFSAREIDPGLGSLRVTDVFHPGGSELLVAEPSGDVVVRDLASGAERARLRCKLERVRAAAFCEDGRRIAGVTEKRSVALWDRVSGAVERTSQTEHDLECVAWSADGKKLAAWGGARVSIVDAEGDGQLRVASVDGEGPHALALNADGSRFVTWSGKVDTEKVRGGAYYAVELWDTADLRRLRTWATNARSLGSGRVEIARRGGGWVAIPTGDSVTIVDVTTAKDVMQLRHERERWPRIAALNDEGTRLVACYGKPPAPGIVSVWDLEKREVLRDFTGLSRAGGAVSFLQGGKRLLVLTLGRTLALWDVESGETIFDLEDAERAFAVAMPSPDSHWILTRTATGLLQLWPADPLGFARARKPREFSPRELDELEIGSAEERAAYRARWRTDVGREDVTVPAEEPEDSGG